MIERENRDGLAILSLNRPEKLNSLNVELFVRLDAELERLETEVETIGCVVIRGAGPCFSTGHDLADIAAGEKLPKRNFQQLVIERLAGLPQPVIAAVHGYCYTGGLEVALAADLIVAAESAKFADTHSKWALSPFWGMSQRLPRRIGRARANEMMFTCRTYSGAQAAAFGLADQVVPDEALEATVEALAREILANSWFINRWNKQLARETDGMPLAAGLAHEIYKSWGTGPDARERLEAFLNRKKTPES